MTSIIREVPIDLDNGRHGIMVDTSREMIERAILTAASQGHCSSAWSASSGSCYDEEDPATSPIDLGGKWYWNSPVDASSGSTSSGGSSYTHDSGYLSRSNSLENKIKSIDGHKIEPAKPRPICQVISHSEIHSAIYLTYFCSFTFAPFPIAIHLDPMRSWPSGCRATVRLSSFNISTPLHDASTHGIHRLR